jgi:hypothetical protein
VNPIALDAIGWKYYVMFICLDIVELVIAWFLIVETKGLALEEIAVLFDGIDAPVAINEAPYNGVPYEGHAVSAEKEKEKEKDEFIEEHV